MGNHCLSVFAGESSSYGFRRQYKISSIHSRLLETSSDWVRCPTSKRSAPQTAPSPSAGQQDQDLQAVPQVAPETHKRGEEDRQLVLIVAIWAQTRSLAIELFLHLVFSRFPTLPGLLHHMMCVMLRDNPQKDPSAPVVGVVSQCAALGQTRAEFQAQPQMRELSTNACHAESNQYNGNG